MAKFWSYVTQGKYGIGCTGQSIYVYENDTEVARLKGFKYTYKACISPKLNHFALKSTEGVMYVCSLQDFSLITKKRFMKADSPQDHMFTFSLSGDEIISVDQSHGGIHSCISRYSVPELELKQRIFDDSTILEPCAIELVTDEIIYALIMERNSDGVADKFSVARIENGKLINKKYIPYNVYNLYSAFKDLQSNGFTEKAKQWNPLSYLGEDLSDIENKNYSIAELYENT